MMNSGEIFELNQQIKGAVALCCNSAFAPYAFFLLSQIYRETSFEGFDVLLLSIDDIVIPNSLSYLPIRVKKFHPEDHNYEFPGSDRINFSSYLRIFLPEYFSEYDRILYLDSDMYFVHGDVSRLLKIFIPPEFVIGAVRTSHQRTSFTRKMVDFEHAGISPRPYFNAGMLLIDVKRWKQAKTTERVLSAIKNNTKSLVMHDQSALNFALSEEWGELSPKWNWMYSGRFSYFIEALNPAIIHFAGRRKPWAVLSGEFPDKYPAAYKDFFRLHYPSLHKNFGDIATIFNSAKFHKKSLLKHWWDLRRLSNYFNGAPGLYEVKKPLR